jgi:hypothetical protein
MSLKHLNAVVIGGRWTRRRRQKACPSFLEQDFRQHPASRL